jgi:hypothetical protein
MLKVGDKVVVQGILPPAKVDCIWFDKETARLTIELNWGDRGTSRVYGHDEGDIWYKYESLN